MAEPEGEFAPAFPVLLIAELIAVLWMVRKRAWKKAMEEKMRGEKKMRQRGALQKGKLQREKMQKRKSAYCLSRLESRSYRTADIGYSGVLAPQVHQR